MQDKKIIVLVVLGIAAVFSLVYGILTPSKVRREIAAGSTGVIETTRASIERGSLSAPGAVSSPGRPRRTEASSWGRDPFSSGPAVSPTNISDMALTGILWDDAAPLAMINDNPVGVGDKIGGYTVVEIKKDRLTLTDGTERFELSIPH